MKTEGTRDRGNEKLRAVVREVGSRYGRRYWLDCVAQRRAPVAMYRALGEVGLLGVDAPEEYGGRGGGVTDMATVIEELAHAGTPLQQFVLGGFSRQLILRHGSSEQREKYVAPVVRGEKTFCFATTEREAGANTFKNRTMATSRGDCYVIEGEKRFIGTADVADYMMVVCRTSAYDADERRSGMSIIVVDLKNTDGVSLEPMNIGVGMPERQWKVTFDGAVVPSSALIGVEGAGATYLFDALNPERIGVAAQCLGLGQFALDKAVRYSRERAPFGSPIAAYQALQHPMALAATHLASARLMTYHAANRFDESSEDVGPEANMAMLLASRAAVEATEIAIQVHGGSAFDLDTDVLSIWPYVRLHRVAPISNEMLLNYIGQHVLDLPRSY